MFGIWYMRRRQAAEDVEKRSGSEGSEAVGENEGIAGSETGDEALTPGQLTPGEEKRAVA
jgi:hypothetical protein